MPITANPPLPRRITMWRNRLVRRRLDEVRLYRVVIAGLACGLWNLYSEFADGSAGDAEWLRSTVDPSYDMVEHLAHMKPSERVPSLSPDVRGEIGASVYAWTRLSMTLGHLVADHHCNYKLSDCPMCDPLADLLALVHAANDVIRIERARDVAVARAGWHLSAEHRCHVSSFAMDDGLGWRTDCRSCGLIGISGVGDSRTAVDRALRHQRCHQPNAADLVAIR